MKGFIWVYVCLLFFAFLRFCDSVGRDVLRCTTVQKYNSRSAPYLAHEQLRSPDGRDGDGGGQGGGYGSVPGLSKGRF